jgi:hypothetical protein
MSPCHPTEGAGRSQAEAEGKALLRSLDSFAAEKLPDRVAGHKEVLVTHLRKLRLIAEPVRAGRVRFIF